MFDPAQTAPASTALRPGPSLVTAPLPRPLPRRASGRRRANGRPRAALRRLLSLAGPGVVVAVAYVDPGNLATNTQAGARLGTSLLWVVLTAGAAAMVIQCLAARLGIVSGRNLAEHCRDRFPRPVSRLLWLQAEVVTMATDVAEVVGGAIALHLLLGVPFAAGGVLVAAFGVALLCLRSCSGGRPQRFGAAVAVLLLGLTGCFVVQAWLVDADLLGAASGLRPSLAGDGALLLATGIIGATVMPHAIYVHSGLSGEVRAAATTAAGTTTAGWLRGALRRSRAEILVSLSIAAVVNGLILVVAAAAFSGTAEAAAAETLEGAHAALGAAGGPALAFALALLISGLAAAGVGTLAGDVIMQGFLQRRISLPVRRLVTVAPAVVLLCLPVDLTTVLVLSQVVLSFGVPFALVPLVVFCRSRRIMGEYRCGAGLLAVASVITGVLVALNAWLLVATLA